jgi:ADP-heptose:LPS heptosyltransferase
MVDTMTINEEIGLILPGHPKWPAFIAMAKKIIEFDNKKVTQYFTDNFPRDCNNTLLFSFCNLRELGLSADDAIKNIECFQKYGGFDEWEIIYNVPRNYLHTIDALNRKIVFGELGNNVLGDNVILTGIIRNLKKKYPHIKVGIKMRHNDLFLYNPNIAELNIEQPDTELCIIGSCPLSPPKDFPILKTDKVHYAEMLNIIIQEKLGLRWDYTNIKPDLHLGDTKNPVREKLGFNDAYWLINSGFHNLTIEKHYPYYQKVVDLLRGKIQFVQHGGAIDTHTPLEGVLSIVGQTTVLELAAAFRECSGSLGGTSSHAHLAAAFDRPCISLNGGIENHDYTNYKNQTSFFKNIGCKAALYPGGPCFIFGINEPGVTKCTNWRGDHAACMDLITPEMVAAEIMKYKN